MRNKILIISAFILASCGDRANKRSAPVDFNNVKSIQEVPYRSMGNSIVMTVTQDSCEYIVFCSADGAAMVHKAKCKNH